MQVAPGSIEFKPRNPRLVTPRHGLKMDRRGIDVKGDR